MSRQGDMTSNGKGQDAAARPGQISFADDSNHATGQAHVEQQQRFSHDPTLPQSPCFIHSQLDRVLESNRRDPSYFSIDSPLANGQESGHNISQVKGSTSIASSNSRQNRKRPEPRHRAAQGAVEPESGSEGESGSDASTDKDGSSSDNARSYSESGSEDDESDRVRSLTRQLAETAVGVREMSKQLGRATVKSTIQSVLIITKARDNHLIKLTRELAIWLMITPRNGKETGLVVYVDAQLRQSKRFDADGIRREYPHLFIPVSSRQTSLSDTETETNGRKTTDTGSGNNSQLNSMSHSREEAQLRYWTSDMCSRSPHLFDFVVTLGGDGTVLFCSWLFQRIVPPVLPFALGSLGFLTNFDYSDYKKVLKSALDTGIRVNLRMRFTATVYRATSPVSLSIDRKKRQAIRSGKTGEIIMRTIQEGGWNRLESPLPAHQDLRGTFTESSEVKDSNQDRSAPRPSPAAQTGRDGIAKGDRKDKEVMCFSTRPVETFEVLNDLVVDRGPSPYVSQLEVFGDEHHMTTAQADGLCISTPTGSTAYSLSAGGSLVHPEIPAILITPICPHTLSFRPMLLPDSMELRIAVPYNSRSTAWASFDGRGRVELKQGDHIKVTASRYPFPTVCAENQSIDWFQSISRTLKWNERQRQKSFVVLEEGEQEQEQRKEEERKQANKKTNVGEDKGKPETKQLPDKMSDVHDDDDEDDIDEQEEEEEAFDIDDTSTAATRASSPDFNKERHLHTHHHHHHHHRHSSHGNGRSSKSGSSTPGSSTSSMLMNNLQPLTMTKSGSSASGMEKKVSSGGKKNGVSFDDSNASVNTYRDAEPTNGAEFQQVQQDAQLHSTDTSSMDSTVSDNHNNSIVQPSTRSLLDSPDRFGLAGPPMPPRALSERHLTCADFRLDGGKVEDNHESNDDQQASVRQSSNIASVGRNKSRSRSNSKLESSSTLSSNDPLEQTRAPLLEPGGPSKAASRLYKKLRGKTKSNRSSSGDSKPFDGLDLSRNSSRGTGAALVVYGQDDSDSDSTAEG